MRIALIILALTALVFIGSIVYSLTWKSGEFFQKKTDVASETPLAIESLKYQIKTEEKINELNKKIDLLTQQSAWTIVVAKNTDSLSVSQSGSEDTKKALPISGKFLARVMPTLEFTVTKNSGIYDLHIFDLATEYTTYIDSKFGMRLVVSTLSYDTFLKNFRALGKDVYVLNETKTFPFRSFYLNPPKADSLVRIVLEVESQAILISIPKTKFPQLKTLLLKK
jgi:hypothetical protein